MISSPKLWLQRLRSCHVTAMASSAPWRTPYTMSPRLAMASLGERSGRCSDNIFGRQKSRGRRGATAATSVARWGSRGLPVAGAACVEAAYRRRLGRMYWCCGQLDGRRERLALHCLGLSGYEVYVPRIQAPRKATVALFPSYVFIAIEMQWHAARWAPGMLKLIMAGDQPARVPDAAIAELYARERDGLVILPSAPRFRPGDRVRVTSGPLGGFRGLVDGLKPHQRVAVLLELLGSRRPIEMAAADVALAGG
jgi:transcriptional antiterminator RfaH